MIDPRERFTATADDYVRYRPDYPAALADWLIEIASLRPGDPVVDLGCGTGISTRFLASRGFSVIGVDPNEGMLRHAEGATYRKGESTATGLSDASAKLVTAAQAFHWFDVPPTLREIRRILRPDGWAAAFWNLRAESPFLAEYEAALRRFSGEYAGLRRPKDAIADIQARVATLPLRKFPHVQRLDLDGFVGRSRSSSYVAHGVRDREGFERELRRLFDRHQSGGYVEFAYRCVALAWKA